MLMGAFFAVWGADVTGSWQLGLVIGMVAGMAAGACCTRSSASRSGPIRSSSGTAINFLALGLTGYLYIDIYGDQGTPTTIPEIPDVNSIPRGIPGSRTSSATAFGSLNLMIWLSFVVLVASYFVMFRTPIGLRIRSVGEHPRAADTVGISVYGIRYGACHHLGRACRARRRLPLARPHPLFDQNMTAGRGFIALAALIFGNWRPFGAFAACLLFGFSSALADRLPDVLRAGKLRATPVQCAPVRAHAHRRGGGRRAVDTAGRGRTSVRQAVAWHGAETEQRGARSSRASHRSRRFRSRSTSRASVTATTCFTRALRSRSQRCSAFVCARARAPGPPASALCPRRACAVASQRSAACSASSASAWRRRHSSRSASTALLEYVGSRD